MKSVQHIVTSSNSPLTIPIDHRSGVVGIGATPAGAGNYTVTYSLTPLQSGLTINPLPITEMTAETAIATVNIEIATVLVVTLNSGTSVTIDLAQSDV